MSNQLRLILLLHNHQPIGNFDGVFEQAYRDSYLPFLETFAQYDRLKIALHVSGPLMEWLEHHHPEYVDRVASLVAAGRIEIIGGAYYEPILTMIPSRDRIGQITKYTQWLEQRLGADVKGMWIAERVWEQALTADLSRAGIEYTFLDDYHFKNAGLREEQLTGYYVTEDDGNTLAVFPGSEKLRYLIPFADPEETIQHLRRIADTTPDPVVVFGDDGEKFGTWPETKRHVYGDGWLRKFFDALVTNQEWLQVTTPAEAFSNTLPTGKTYLPEGSYREMTEWALPTERKLDYDHLQHEMEKDPRWPRISGFMRGGFWRNFKVKYPEANEMYARMMELSTRLDDLATTGCSSELIEQARTELYQGQCNCSYWHGAFGGIYLPHLRNAVYSHLIAADNLLEQATGKKESWVHAEAKDLNFDMRQELRLANDQLVAYLAPAMGGQLYEFDVRSIRHNLGATLTRRPESYHERVQRGTVQQEEETSSIHDRVVFKHEGLDQRLQYDPNSRKSLLDHFYDHNVSLEAIADGLAVERGNFVEAVYDARLRRNPDRIQAQMTRTGLAFNKTVQITKGVSLQAGSSSLEIAYLLEGLPTDHDLHFGVEFNFAGLPAEAEDRYFYSGDLNRLGQLQTRLDLENVLTIGMVDEWLGINLKLTTNQPTSFWTFPVETVSQSEGGFELVHQSVVVLPHWFVRGDQDGRWSVTMCLDVDTRAAQTRTDSMAEIMVN